MLSFCLKRMPDDAVSPKIINIHIMILQSIVVNNKHKTRNNTIINIYNSD